MRTRGIHRTSHRAGRQAGAVALAGLTLLAIGAGSPAQAADQPAPGDGAPTKAAIVWGVGNTSVAINGMMMTAAKIAT